MLTVIVDKRPTKDNCNVNVPELPQWDAPIEFEQRPRLEDDDATLTFDQVTNAINGMVMRYAHPVLPASTMNKSTDSRSRKLALYLSIR